MAPRNPKKGKPARGGDRVYRACAAEWQRQRDAESKHKRDEPDQPRGSGGEWLTDTPDLPVDPLSFLQTLRGLGYITQDQRFNELRRYLTGSGLIDRKTGKWSLHGTKIT